MKCSFCTKKISIAMQMNCKWCKSVYCPTCLPIEFHNCKNTEDCKSNALKELNSKLPKTTSTKLVHI